MGQLAVFGPGDALTVGAAAVQESRSPQLEALVLGGRLGTIPAITGIHHTPGEIVESSNGEGEARPGGVGPGR